VVSAQQFPPHGLACSPSRRQQAVIWQLLHVMLKTAALVRTIHGKPTAVLGCRDPRLIPRMGAAGDQVQGPAEIPDDFAKQLCVEPLAWGICP
jgi:hypothetical protein